MADQHDARHWLALAVDASKAGLQQDAERAYLAALALDPTHAEAHLGLGLTYMALRRFPEAVAPLQIATQAPDAPDFWSACLAQSLYMNGDFSGSAEAFDHAARREPLGENARATLARSRCLAALIDGSSDQAFDRYQAEINGEIESTAAFAEDASAILAVFGHARAAAAAGRWRLAHTPDDRTTAYRLQVLEGASIDRAAPDYIEAHFDAFADRFDHQLVDMLNYRAPADLGALLRVHRSRFDQVLDLGCGTGLAMPVLEPLAAAVTGVDLSSGMLARATARGGYQTLVRAEAVAFLADHPATFDLVFAADLLIYFGDLTALFTTVAGALRPGGYFAFSTECGETDWALLTSGRFAHADAYIDRLAAPVFSLKARTPTRLRQEGRDPVKGVLHVLVRA